MRRSTPSNAPPEEYAASLTLNALNASAQILISCDVLNECTVREARRAAALRPLATLRQRRNLERTATDLHVTSIREDHFRR
jgi:hypothetical protein